MKSIKNKTYLLKPVWYVKDLFWRKKWGRFGMKFGDKCRTDKMSNKRYD
jgi:hypothetical protein